MDPLKQIVEDIKKAESGVDFSSPAMDPRPWWQRIRFFWWTGNVKVKKTGKKESWIGVQGKVDL